MSMKKRVTMGLLLVTLVLALAGCGTNKKEEKAKELIAKMIEAADGAVVSKSDCTSELDVNFVLSTFEEDWSVEFKTHNEYDKESGRVNSEVVYYDNEEPYTTQFHMTEEQGIFYIYGKREDTSWIKYEACFAKEDMSRNFVSDMNLENAEIVNFKENADEIDGKKVHKLSVKLKDASIRELLFESGFKRLFWGSEYNSIDLSDVTVQIDYCVDADTNQVIKLEARLDGLQNLLREYVLLSRNISLEEEYREVNINNCKLVYDNISYEDIKVPMLNFEIKKDSLLIHQKDTVYTIKEMDAVGEVTCPKGWVITGKNNHEMVMCRFDEQVNVLYGVYMPNTIEDCEAKIAADIESIKEAGNYVSDKKGPKIGEYETYEILMRDGIVVYAYVPLKRAVALVEVTDFTSSRLDKTLPEILEYVKFTATEW